MPSNFHIQRLPYCENSAKIFAHIADLNWPVFLDSCSPYSHQGRYDIIAADPIATLVTRHQTTLISRDGHTTESTEDPFNLLKQLLLPEIEAIPGIPFSGGAIGYFGYDLARRIERLPELANDAEHIPELAVGIYTWAVIVDHQDKNTTLVAQPRATGDWQTLLKRFAEPRPGYCPEPFKLTSAITGNMDKAAYSRAFTRIKQFLKEGDCYQVNLTQRFSASCQGDPWQVYLALRQRNPAPFSAYLNFPGVQVLSSSPERFLKVEAGKVETKPIKGTLPRKADAEEDRKQVDKLANSLKDRAENLMIVDLLRNDLGKSCKNATVKVPALFEVESYATVHHLVSTITGELAEDQKALDLLKNCFPGGSITGAPKIRAMAIIEELEPNRRGVYCGAIGYIGFDGNMDTNIAIRTLVHSDDAIRFWAGGGIVNDSVEASEYQECFDKAAALFDVLSKFRPS